MASVHVSDQENTRHEYFGVRADAIRHARTIENASYVELAFAPVVAAVTFNTNKVGIIAALEGRFETTERIM